jgi:hypothetical protein
MDGRYMIVSYLQKPNGKWDELTEFKKHCRTKHIQSAKVILDLQDKKVIKNGLNPSASYDDMLEFYKRVLGSKLDPYLPSE